jgi:hypothetical protein
MPLRVVRVHIHTNVHVAILHGEHVPARTHLPFVQAARASQVKVAVVVSVHPHTSLSNEGLTDVFGLLHSQGFEQVPPQRDKEHTALITRHIVVGAAVPLNQ